MAKDKLHVRVNSPEKVIWEGDADWVSSENTAGPFDILPMHTNFISVIEDKEIRIQIDGKIEKYKYPISVIYAHSNKVNIYTNI